VRVCLDTNVLIAAFASRGLCSDVLRAVLTEHDLILGEVILVEFRRVLKTKFKVPEDRIASAVAVFSAVEIVGKPAEPSTLQMRDRADRWVIATALAGQADVLVSGDTDLLDIADQAPLPILNPRAFWELLRSGKLR
jgi:putative PIN family toxin of toxin-antitoxin system